jgi:hypothetical protein
MVKGWNLLRSINIAYANKEISRERFIYEYGLAQQALGIKVVRRIICQ